MKFFIDLPENLESSLKPLQKDLKEMCAKMGLPSLETLVRAEEVSQLNTLAFEIVEGSLRVSNQDHLFFLLEKGDLWCFEMSGDLQFSSDFSVKVKSSTYAELLKAVSSTPSSLEAWKRISDRYLQVFAGMAANFMQASLRLDAETEIFDVDDMIIEQGSSSRDVYTLIDGQAKVVCDGVEIAKVEPGEIFGALAALSGIPRSASIVAEEPCTVMRLDEERFLKLIQSRPETMLRLCRDLSNKLMQTNQKLLSEFKT